MGAHTSCHAMPLDALGLRPREGKRKGGGGVCILRRSTASGGAQGGDACHAAANAWHSPCVAPGWRAPVTKAPPLALPTLAERIEARRQRRRGRGAGSPRAAGEGHAAPPGEVYKRRGGEVSTHSPPPSHSAQPSSRGSGRRRGGVAELYAAGPPSQAARGGTGQPDVAATRDSHAPCRGHHRAAEPAGRCEATRPHGWSQTPPAPAPSPPPAFPFVDVEVCGASQGGRQHRPRHGRHQRQRSPRSMPVEGTEDEIGPILSLASLNEHELARCHALARRQRRRDRSRSPRGREAGTRARARRRVAPQGPLAASFRGHATASPATKDAESQLAWALGVFGDVPAPQGAVAREPVPRQRPRGSVGAAGAGGADGSAGADSGAEGGANTQRRGSEDSRGGSDVDVTCARGTGVGNASAASAAHSPPRSDLVSVGGSSQGGDNGSVGAASGSFGGAMGSASSFEPGFNGACLQSASSITRSLGSVSLHSIGSFDTSPHGVSTGLASVPCVEGRVGQRSSRGSRARGRGVPRTRLPFGRGAAGSGDADQPPFVLVPVSPRRSPQRSPVSPTPGSHALRGSCSLQAAGMDALTRFPPARAAPGVSR